MHAYAVYRRLPTCLAAALQCHCMTSAKHVGSEASFLQAARAMVVRLACVTPCDTQSLLLSQKVRGVTLTTKSHCADHVIAMLDLAAHSLSNSSGLLIWAVARWMAATVMNPARADWWCTADEATDAASNT